MVTIKQRRKTDRDRLKRWRRKKLEGGHKQIQIMLTPEAQRVLERVKKQTGEPFVQIINRAIMSVEEGHASVVLEKNKDSSSSGTKNDNSDTKAQR
jgi:hypothetical protein